MPTIGDNPTPHLAILNHSPTAHGHFSIDELKDNMKEIKADIKTLLLAQGAQRSAAAKA